MKLLLVRAYITWFGTGCIPFAPGTFGSAAALPLIYALLLFTSPTMLLIATFALTFLGIIAINLHLPHAKTNDPGYIVIDEVAGQMLTFWLYLFFLSLVPTDNHLVSPLLSSFPVNNHSISDIITTILSPILEQPFVILSFLVAFLSFRLFDIWKPWPIRWCDHHIHGGLGVMVDDLLAALYASVLTLFVMILFGFIVG